MRKIRWKKSKWINRAAVGMAALVLMGSRSVAAASAVGQNLAEGEYQVEVTLGGGSGRATVESPAKLTVADGEVMADLVWSSPYYDYMLVDGVKYEPVNTEGNSEFQIPVSEFDSELTVIADTVAMSTPHEVTYTLNFTSSTLEKMLPASGETETTVETTAGADQERETVSGGTEGEEAASGGSVEDDSMSAGAGLGETVPADITQLAGLTYDHRLPLAYAEQFTVDYYEGGYALLTIADSGRFLIVPEGMAVPEGLSEDIAVLEQPLENIYLVATSAMDFFASLDALDQIRLSGTKADGWYVEEARQAMEAGDILYAGKYSTPDYEQILAAGCGLSIESTMIFHTPEVKEKLDEFGIPVLVERSSYESHPLGRAEWIKLYGVLLGKEAQAETLFQAQTEKVNAVESEKSTGKTVAFFYMNSNGYANVRESGDYVAKMIELAGGTYIFQDLGNAENALSTVNMQIEEFYAGAKDADVIIYNSTIDGEIRNVSELLKKSELLADFKAVKEGNVWCTTQNLFQKTTGLADMIVDIHTMLVSENPKEEKYTYIYPMED